MQIFVHQDTILFSYPLTFILLKDNVATDWFCSWLSDLYQCATNPVKAHGHPAHHLMFSSSKTLFAFSACPRAAAPSPANPL